MRGVSKDFAMSGIRARNVRMESELSYWENWKNGLLKTVVLDRIIL